MQSFYIQVLRSTCYGKQAQAEKKRTSKTYGRSNKEVNALIEKKFYQFVKNKKKREKEMQISDDEDKKSVSSVVQSVASGETFF